MYQILFLLVIALAPLLRADASVGLWAAVAFVPQGTTGATTTEIQPVSSAPVTPGQVVPIPAQPMGGQPVQPSGSPQQTVPGLPPGVTIPARATPGQPGFPPTPATLAPTGPTPGPSRPGTTTSAVKPEPPCVVTVLTPNTSVSHAGGLVTLRLRFAPPTCSKDAQSESNWFSLKGPPALTADGAAVLQVLVQPNLTSASRLGLINVGEQTLKLHQTPGKRAGFAVSPARIEITNAAGKNLETHTQTLMVWSDDPDLAYTVEGTAASSAWIAVKLLAAKNEVRRYEVTVRPGSLPSGIHVGGIRVTAAGAVNGPITVPVIAKIER